MPPLVRTAVSLMFLAFAFYSVGVWSAFFSRHLRAWHALLFWLGFSAVLVRGSPSRWQTPTAPI
ncbi:MAG TPA: hypothetical protein PKA66_06525 [Gemmatimonadales bacterium]|nr:hypothetical protein [Gemmatimonadales bacterium]